MSVNDVRVEIYRSFVERGSAPSVGEVADATGMTQVQVEAAFRQLHDDDVIVLRPRTHDIWLAHPFCDGPAPFDTRAGERRWDAICIWDGLGILAVTGADGEIRTACPDCREQLIVRIEGGEIRGESDMIVHYGVPANRWYEDVAYT